MSEPQSKKLKASKPEWDLTGDDQKDLLDLYVSGKINARTGLREIFTLRPGFKQFDGKSFSVGIKAAKKDLLEMKKEAKLNSSKTKNPNPKLDNLRRK